MSTFTENYNLIKPDDEDYYDVANFNENFDTIDTLIAETETTAQEISAKIGDISDTNANTLFGILNQMTNDNSNNGFTAIKSIQKVSFNGYMSEKSFSINTVVPENCFVYLQRMSDLSSYAAVTTSYTLSASAIIISSDSKLTAEYWIIEFC